MIWIYAVVMVACIAVVLYQGLVISELKDANEKLALKGEPLDAITTLLREDRENFLKVDALGMTRDELAAFQKQALESGGVPGAWDEDPCEAVKQILVEWHVMYRKMQDAEARATAAEWRSQQYPALIEVNADYVEIVAGTRNLLSTGPAAPFGVYTGRFDPFSRLALFLIEQALRAPGIVAATGVHPSQTAPAPPERGNV